MITGELSLDEARTRIEKVMMEQPSESTELERKMYIAGVVDTWKECEKISESTRETLYLEYGP